MVRPENLDWQKPFWRISYAYDGSNKAWFEFNGSFKELCEMMIEHLNDVGIGEIHINPLGMGTNRIDPKAAFKPNPEIIFKEENNG